MDGLVRLPWVDDAGFVGEHDGLDAVAEAEFHQHSGDVGLHRCFADDEFGGDLGVGKSSGDEPEDVELAGGQFVESGWWRMRGCGR